MPKPRKKDFLAASLSANLENCGPEDICKVAIDVFRPVKIFVGFSGGFDSLVGAHWSMNNVPNCEVFHANTGIGIEKTREFVRETCRVNNWPLTEIRAKEDCNQDYDEIVKEQGFPGPAMHSRMFQRLKERAVRELLRRNKTKRSDNVMLLTGIRKDESVRRSGYKYSLLAFTGNILWVNAFYYKEKSWFSSYIRQNDLQQNPVSEILGMSGECLCGAYAHKGEKDLIKIVCPETFSRIENLEKQVKERGFAWGWEDAPPRQKKCKKTNDLFMPFCVGCEKVENGQ